jgi:chromate transporter
MMQLEIFKTFFLLGLYSFGGPAAHIGYFRKNFVEEKKWLSEQEYANYIALSQFLPGPGSSQVGFSIGLHRGGLCGGIMAFLGFTLPSFFLMLGLAIYSFQLIDQSWFQGLIHGLKILAAAVVADAIIKMFSSFCKKKISMALAFITAAILINYSSIIIQLALLLAAALIGMLTLSENNIPAKNNGKKINYLSGILFRTKTLCRFLPNR